MLVKPVMLRLPTSSGSPTQTYELSTRLDAAGMGSTYGGSVGDVRTNNTTPEFV